MENMVIVMVILIVIPLFIVFSYENSATFRTVFNPIGRFLWKLLIQAIQFVYIVGALTWWDEDMFEKDVLRMLFVLLFKISLFVVPYMLYERTHRIENQS